jgi:acetolactate synthase-1/2/3 large subunit
VLSSDKTDRPYPNFPLIAEGYMIPGRDVWTLAELEPALREMLASKEPFLLDVHVEYQEHVLPMIPAGGSHKDIMVE